MSGNELAINAVLPCSFGVLLHEVVTGETPRHRTPLRPLRHAYMHHACLHFTPLCDEHQASVGGKLCSNCFLHIPCRWSTHMLLTPMGTPTKVSICCCSIPGECPQGVFDLWRHCIAREPSERPSSADVVFALEALHSVKP